MTEAAKDRYPRPDWERIAESTPQEHAAWSEVAQRWVDEICACSPGYGSARSENFLLGSALDKGRAARLLKFAERARRTIVTSLDGLADHGGFGPHVILVFESDDEYYEYIAPFYPDGGHFASSSGVHLNRGYGHFVLPRAEPDDLEAVVAHELAHALVSHLPLPRWLDEGIAVNLESVLCPRFARRLEPGWIEQHRRGWDTDSVQHYWSGRAFSRPDELSRLSYELAWVSVRSLAEDYPRFRAFALEASYEDAGQGSARKHLGGGLGHQFEALLGEGDWEPDPKRWEQ